MLFFVKFSKKEELKGLYLKNLSFNDKSNHLKVKSNKFLMFCFCYFVLRESSLEARKTIYSTSKVLLVIERFKF